MSARYAAGLGARRGVAAADLVDLLREALARHNIDLSQVTLFTLESKAEEQGFHEAAEILGLQLVFLPLADLRARKGAAPTHSPRVQAMFGVGSVSEAAALVGAGPGSRLLGPRIATRIAACALAQSAPDNAKDDE